MHNYTEKVASLRLFAGHHKKLLYESRPGRGILILIGALAILLSMPAVGQDIVEKKISFNVKAVSIKEALAEIEKQSGIVIASGKDLDQYASLKVTLAEKNISVRAAVERVLKNTRLEQALVSDQIVIRQASGEKKEAPAPKVQARVRPGTVSGKIIDADSGEPLIGSTIMVKGTTVGGIADVEGHYSLRLEPGSYDLEFRFVGYQTKLIQGVVISDGAVTSLNVAMQVAFSQLGEVVITAEYSKASVEGLLVKQKNNISMTDGISSAQIRLTPDNNTAQVLKRISGVTIQDDKFVTIRGLSDRYTNVMINGASAPSTEPNRRNFSFDIVPSALLDNVVVNKTASPDMPGEFTGGIVMVNTKEIPDKNFVSFTYGRGVNTSSMGKPMVSTRMDKYAELGIVDEEKKWFGDGRLWSQTKYYNYVSSGDQPRMDSIASKIPNRWKLYRYPYAPMQNYQLSAGVVKALKDSRIGFTSALTYRNEQTIESGKRGQMQNENHMFASDRYKYTTSIGALLNTTYKNARHRLSWKNLYNSRYGNQFDDQFGFHNDNNVNQRRTSNVTLTNRLIQSRLEGEHSITRANIRLDWNADITDLLQEQPDGRFVIGSTTSDDPELATDYNFQDGNVTNGGLYAAVLNETKKNAGVNVSVPFQVLRGRQVIKAGYSLSRRENDYGGTFLRLLSSGQGISPELQGLPYYEIVTPERFAAGELVYRPAHFSSGSTGDRYEGTQALNAYYGMLDLTLLKKFRATGGLRYEDNRIKMNTTFYSKATGESYDTTKLYVEHDWLPSVNLIFSATKKFNVRASYSKTLARPDFKERSPFIYFDFAENLYVYGSKELEITRIVNYDFRLEYYFTPGEVVSASVFYKEFSKPVERIFNTGNNSNSVEYRNLISAEARGIEFNFIKSLNFTGLTSHWTSNLYLSGNLAILEGDITALVTTKTTSGKDSSYVTSYKRPVQGMSPYTINGGLAYQTARWGVNVAYNKYGRRIVNGGGNPRSVQYEVPRDVMDVQLNWLMFQKKLTARINISDLLNQPFVIYANESQTGSAPNGDPKGDEYNPAYDYLLYKVNKGTSYSFSLTYTF